MDTIWDRKSFEVGGHWPLWWGWKNRMITQNRQKSTAKKTTTKTYYLYKVFLSLTQACNSTLSYDKNKSDNCLSILHLLMCLCLKMDGYFMIKMTNVIYYVTSVLTLFGNRTSVTRTSVPTRNINRHLSWISLGCVWCFISLIVVK